MQLWCPEARVVVIDAEPQEGPKIAVPGVDASPIKFVEASPTLNRMDFNPGGIKVPLTALCFGQRCGVWQWADWYRGRDGKHYTEAQRVAGDIKPDAYPIQQLGYCGKSAGSPYSLHPPYKPTTLPAPEPANDEQAPEKGKTH